MPSVQDHLAQAVHNEQFAAAIDRIRFSDWTITALFYAALQYVDSYLASRKISPGAHDVRDNLVGNEPFLKKIAFQYFRLKSLSRNARYSCRKFTPDDISQAERDHLAKIKTHIQNFHNPPQKNVTPPE